MDSDWEEFTFEQLKSSAKSAFAMGPFGSRIKAENFVMFGVPVIKGGNLNGNFINENEFDYLTDEKANELSSSVAIKGDIVITHRGTIGQVGIIPAWSKFDKYIVSQSQLKLSFNRTKVNPYFIYYYLRSPLGQKALLANTSQVGVPAIAQALTSIRNITVSLPKKDHQDEIVEFLLNIDKKILLNQCMNDTLEGIAQALFKSWFVDFDPVKAKAEGREPDGMDSAIADLFPSSFIESPLGLIPQGWEVKGLDEIATFLNGLALQKYPTLDPENYLPVIKISQLRSGNTEGADKASTDVPPDYIITDGDILFSWSGSLEVEIWCGGRGALNQHLFKVSSKDFPKWFYFLWTRQHLDNFQKIAEGKATTMGHIQRKHLSEAKVICPPVRVIQGVNEIMETLLEKSVQLKLENRIIANLRDLLLPRLISGELPVGAISETVEAVAS